MTITNSVTLEQAVADIKSLRASLKHAIAIIEKHVPVDALGIDTAGDLLESHLNWSWPVLDEHLHYMNKDMQATEHYEADQ